jgi:hypothetical protein
MNFLKLVYYNVVDNNCEFEELKLCCFVYKLHKKLYLAMQPEVWLFGPTRAWPSPRVIRLGLARHEATGRAWAAT